MWSINWSTNYLLATAYTEFQDKVEYWNLDPREMPRRRNTSSTQKEMEGLLPGHGARAFVGCIIPFYFEYIHYNDPFQF